MTVDRANIGARVLSKNWNRSGYEGGAGSHGIHWKPGHVASSGNLVLSKFPYDVIMRPCGNRSSMSRRVAHGERLRRSLPSWP